MGIAGIALESTVEHIASSGFWRLFALVAKRLITIGKTFSKLPFPFTPILYALHFLRAVLRLVNYFRKTKNKNLGETRKFLFSAFKVAIAIVAFALCFFMPVPLVLGTAFLLYSVIKLVDSSGVLIFSFFAHLKNDKNLPENKWRRDQYWDNIIKHISILGIGVAMTLLTAIVLAGGVAAIVWTSPIIILSLAIASVVTVVGIFYLGGLFYQRYQFRNDANLKAEYDTNIKKFSGLFGVWLLVLALVTVPFFLPLAVALWFVAGFLSVCNLYDSIKSIYDYFDKTKVADPKPANLEPKNSLADNATWCYYGTGHLTPYLRTVPSTVKNNTPSVTNLNNNSAEKTPLKNAVLANVHSLLNIAEINHIIVIKEMLVYIKELENKIKQSGFEKEKREIKRKTIIRKLAQTLKDNGRNDSDYLIGVLKKAQKALDKDCDELALKSDKLANKLLNVKTINNINNINGLKAELDELIEYRNALDEQREFYSKKNNSLLDLLRAYEAPDLYKDKNEQPPKLFHQSFFRNTARATQSWKTLQECQEIQDQIREEKQRQASVEQRGNLVANGQLANGHAHSISR